MRQKKCQGGQYIYIYIYFDSIPDGEEIFCQSVFIQFRVEFGQLRMFRASVTVGVSRAERNSSGKRT